MVSWAPHAARRFRFIFSFYGEALRRGAVFRAAARAEGGLVAEVKSTLATRPRALRDAVDTLHSARKMAVWLCLSLLFRRAHRVWGCELVFWPRGSPESEVARRTRIQADNAMAAFRAAPALSARLECPGMLI